MLRNAECCFIFSKILFLITVAPGSLTVTPSCTHLDAADETQQQWDEDDLPLKVLHGGGDGSETQLGKEDRELPEWLLRPRLPPAPAIKASNWVVGGVWGPPGPHLRFYSPVCQEQEATQEAAAANFFYRHNQKVKFISGQVGVLHFNLVFWDDSTSAPPVTSQRAAMSPPPGVNETRQTHSVL